MQTQHLAQLQLHGAAIRLWKSSVGKWHTRSSRFFLPKIQSSWFWYQCSTNVNGSNSWFKNVYFSHKRWDISFFISQTKKKLSSPQQREKTAAQALDASTCSWWNANSCFNELEHIGLRLSAKLMISKKSDSVLERLQWQKMNSKTSRLQGCRFPTRAQRQKDQLFFPHSISVTKYFCERHTTGLT